ncbi:hypothetical protein AB1N83_006173 [Pleurotus pulmonarius]
MGDPTIGALHVTTSVSALLLGCLILQIYTYFSNYPSDSAGKKYLVGLVLLLEFSLQVGLQDMSYTVSVTHAKDEYPFSHLPPMWPATLFLTIFTLPLIETFYFWRIYKLLDKKWPSLMGIFVLFVRVGGWSLYNAKAREVGLSALASHTALRWLVVLLLLLGLLSNVVIIVLMTVYLARHRHSPIGRTRKLVDRLILWTISNGLIAMIPHIMCFILFWTMSQTLVWLCLVPISTKVFAICLLSTLNNRSVAPGIHHHRPSSSKEITVERRTVISKLETLEFARPTYTTVATESDIDRTSDH